jgi:hypothetical protein
MINGPRKKTTGQGRSAFGGCGHECWPRESPAPIRHLEGFHVPCLARLCGTSMCSTSADGSGPQLPREATYTSRGREWDVCVARPDQQKGRGRSTPGHALRKASGTCHTTRDFIPPGCLIVDRARDSPCAPRRILDSTAVAKHLETSLAKVGPQAACLSRKAGPSMAHNTKLVCRQRNLPDLVRPCTSQSHMACHTSLRTATLPFGKH